MKYLWDIYGISWYLEAAFTAISPNWGKDSELEKEPEVRVNPVAAGRAAFTLIAAAAAGRRGVPYRRNVRLDKKGWSAFPE